jgi:cation diffusion facilitator CzcD-associated flavoprotein CzcO
MTTIEDVQAMFPDVDLEAIRTKYALERDRRERADASTMYHGTRGEYANYGLDPHTPVAERDPRTDYVEAVVIGGGIAGLSAAVHLREQGIESVRIIEEGGDFGGTWYWNRYPGLYCDIEAHIYVPMLEKIGKMPSKRYAPGHEVRGFLHDLAKHYDLYADALFHTKATSLTFTDGQWAVTTDRGDAFTATYVVAASGGLTTPKLPAIPGIEDFKGPLFHSSRWDYSYSGGDEFGAPLTGLEGKRVAVIGTGATGVQIIPEVAKYAEEVVVFQRTPSTVNFRGNHETDEHFAGSGEAGWQRRRMDNFLEIVSGANPNEDLVDDSWTAIWPLLRRHNTGTYVSEFSGEVRELYEEYLDARTMNAIRANVDNIVKDPATAELLKPWYRFACKRPTFTDLYLPTYNEPNVKLVDTADFGGPSKVTENSIIVGDEEYPVDLIVVATGFEVGMTAVLSGALAVVGREGRTVHEVWANGIRTVHGYMINEFPNFFQIAPLQSANAVNFSHILQMHGEHIATIIGAAKAAGVDYVEVTREMEDAWSAEISATVDPEHEASLAFKIACTPGFYNGEGKYRGKSTEYALGPVKLQERLAEWRETHMADAFHSAKKLRNGNAPFTVA